MRNKLVALGLCIIFALGSLGTAGAKTRHDGSDKTRHDLAKVCSPHIGDRVCRPAK